GAAARTGRRGHTGDPSGVASRYPGTASPSRRVGLRDRRRGPAKSRRSSRRSLPRTRLRLAAASDTVLLARKCGICRAFFMAEASYTGKDITVLEGLEGGRLGRGVYIGATGARGLRHLVFEVVGNSVDWAVAGRIERI